MKKIIIFSNTSWSLYNFRKNLLKELIKKKFKVIILSNKDETTNKLKDIGCIFYQIKIERRGSKILSEIFTLINIYKIVKNIRPNFLLNFTIKPIIYGSLVSRILKIKTLNTLDGIGATFEITEFKKMILKFLINLYQNKVNNFFFVNSSDLNLFIKKKFILKKRTKLINGTGIDLKYFKYKKNLFKKKIIFLLISRLLYSKGVLNYLDSAILISKKFKKKSLFCVAGKIDKDFQDSIPLFKLKKYQKNPNIKIYYNVKNIKNLIYKSNCVVLPTYYNEGLPRSLLEAASVGRPIITTNIPGCKRIAKNNYNALIYDKKRPHNLNNCIKKFILMKKNKKIDMSLNSNKLAKKFDEKKIVFKYINFLNEKKN